MALTITEALAEIKTIAKRISKKQEFVSGYLYRQDNMRDPLDNQGGAKTAIAAERQGIADLGARVVRIRAEIQKANANTVVTIGGITRSIADWLVWRREVAPGVRTFNGQLRNALAQIRAQAAQKGVPVRGADQPAASPADIVVNIDEQALAKEAETVEEVLGTLDGILSLKNATTVIDV